MAKLRIKPTLESYVVSASKPDFTNAQTLGSEQPKPETVQSSIQPQEPVVNESSGKLIYIIETGFLYKDGQIVESIKGLSQEEIKELLWVHFSNVTYALAQQGKSMERYLEAVNQKVLYPSAHQETLARLNDQLSDQAIELFKNIEPQGFLQLTANIRLCNRTKAEKKEVVMPTLQSISSLIK